MKILLKYGFVIVLLFFVLLVGCMSMMKVSNLIEIIMNDNYIVNIFDVEFVLLKVELMGGKMVVVVLLVKIDSNVIFEIGVVC